MVLHPSIRPANCGSKWDMRCPISLPQTTRVGNQCPLCHPACPGVPWDRSEASVEGSAVSPNRRPILMESNHPTLCHPDRSEAQWRDLQPNRRPTLMEKQTTLPFVIPPVPACRGTEAKRGGGIRGFAQPASNSDGEQPPYTLSSRPERSVVEGSAVSRGTVYIGFIAR